MKLTEQQLSQFFKQAKTAPVDTSIENLNDFSHASDARITVAEKIAENSHLSASYQVINQLQDWSKSVATDIASTRQSAFEGLFAWLRPVLATAALASIVYISYPQFGPTQVTPLATSEKSVFTANFEDTPSQPQSQLPTKATQKTNNDIIYSGGFG
jgi:hypothetical protein